MNENEKEKESWREFEIIDTHAHVFPSKVSSKAAYNIGRYDRGSFERRREDIR